MRFGRQTSKFSEIVWKCQMTVPAVVVLVEVRSTGGTGDWEASVTQFAVCARYKQIPQFIKIRLQRATAGIWQQAADAAVVTHNVMSSTSNQCMSHTQSRPPHDLAGHSWCTVGDSYVETGHAVDVGHRGTFPRDPSRYLDVTTHCSWCTRLRPLSTSTYRYIQNNTTHQTYFTTFTNCCSTGLLSHSHSMEVVYKLVIKKQTALIQHFTCLCSPVVNAHVTALAMVPFDRPHTISY